MPESSSTACSPTTDPIAVQGQAAVIGQRSPWYRPVYDPFVPGQHQVPSRTFEARDQRRGAARHDERCRPFRNRHHPSPSGYAAGVVVAGWSSASLSLAPPGPWLPPGPCVTLNELSRWTSTLLPSALVTVTS